DSGSQRGPGSRQAGLRYSSGRTFHRHGDHQRRGLEFLGKGGHMKSMRKSRYITLLLAGAAATTLAACDQNVMTGQDETLYPDMTACTQERDAGECRSGFEAAQAEHAKQAPKFATKEECEAAGFQN